MSFVDLNGEIISTFEITINDEFDGFPRMCKFALDSERENAILVAWIRDHENFPTESKNNSIITRMYVRVSYYLKY